MHVNLNLHMDEDLQPQQLQTDSYNKRILFKYLLCYIITLVCSSNWEVGFSKKMKEAVVYNYYDFLSAFLSKEVLN